MESKESWNVRTALITQNDNFYFPRHIDAAINFVKILFATFPSRLIISQSGIKLFGWPFSAAALRRFSFPKCFVYDSHFHDFVTPEPAFRHLDRKW